MGPRSLRSALRRANGTSCITLHHEPIFSIFEAFATSKVSKGSFVDTRDTMYSS